MIGKKTGFKNLLPTIF